jgi:type I restriction enzyme, S subunit
VGIVISNETTYKKTILGDIPINWQVKRLGDIFEFKNGLNKEKKYFGEGTPIVNYVDVYNNRQINRDKLQGSVRVTDSEIERFNVKDGDVFFTRTSETIDEIGFSAVAINTEPGTVFSGFVLRAREKQTMLDNLYKKYCFSTYLARKEIITKSSMTTRALTSGTLLSDVNVIIPPIEEQKKIANILSTWDRAIELKQIELNNRITYKENITKKLIIEQAENTKDFDKIKLVTYLKSKYERVGNRDIEPVAVGVFGIRRRSEIFNKELSVDLSNNKVIKQNDLCFGIGTNRIVYDVLFEDSTYCVSPAYGVYEVINCNPYYLKAYLDTYNSYFSRKYMIISARQGKSIEINGLMNEKIAFPALSIQNQIANYLKSIDVYNTKLQLLIEELQIQKKGLMQQLLTGKIRVQT